MRSPDEGLKSEPLRAALKAAVIGHDEALAALLIRHGRGADPRPNLRLAAAFGVEAATSSAAILPVLEQLSANGAAPDSDEVFLPIAAAFAWTEWLRKFPDTAPAWQGLAELASDGRAPVRLGTIAALTAFAVREAANARALLARALEWVRLEDRERRYTAAASLVECLGEKRIASALAADPRLFDYLGMVIDEIADAPRSAERLDGRRRLLLSLPRTLAAVAASATAGERGITWLDEQCARAKHPDVRRALSDTIVGLRANQPGLGETLAHHLRGTLQGSAKPPRDPTRIRPGTGRGRTSRRIK